MEDYKDILKSIFNIGNFFDEVSVIDMDGIIRYCELFVPGVYSFTADEVVGKHIFDVFVSSSKENSEIYKVLTTGVPITFFEENCVTYRGDVVKGFSSIYPLYKRDKMQGVVVALKFFSEGYKNERIEILNYSGVRKSKDFHYTLDNLITEDPYMLSLKKLIKKIAAYDSSVLIYGATGTGKEIVAQSIHYESHRDAMPFISQNCSAIPSNLIESIFFGTEKGSFTGAVSGKGLFELASGGTLFLDELNSMDFALQSKILKSIEEKKVRRIGGHTPISIDVRVIAAINEDPFEAIESRHLRTDLFYRLNVHSVYLSPLKERIGDIDYVTGYYIDYYNQETSKNIGRVSPEVKKVFNSYDWPGNLRELRNVIEGAFDLADEQEITLSHIPGYIVDRSRKLPQDAPQSKILYDPTLTYRENLENLEREIIKHHINSFGTKKDAANYLGVSKQTLNYKLNKLNMKDKFSE